MALDINKIKARLGQLNNKNSARDLLWKPTGKHKIRIVPHVHDVDNQFIELKFHYGLNGKTFLSPDTFNRPDPIVELSNKLKKGGDKEDYKQGMELQPKMRVYVPIIIRGEEKEGVKFWGFGKQVYEQILSFIADPEWGDITDPKTGRDIVIEFTPQEESKKKDPKTGKKYAETAIRIVPNQTPMCDPDDKELLTKIKNQKNIFDIYKEPSYDELKGELEKWLTSGGESSESTDSSAGDESSDSSSEEETATVPAPTKKKEETKKTSSSTASVAEVESAFDDLFNGKK
jgi:hypothetical protein